MDFSMTGLIDRFTPKRTDDPDYERDAGRYGDPVCRWAWKEWEENRKWRSWMYRMMDIQWLHYHVGELEPFLKDKRRSKFRTNLIRPTIERIVAIGTDARPRPMTAPNKDPGAMRGGMSLEEAAQNMNGALSMHWERRHMEILNMRAWRHVLVPGISIFFTGWDAFRDEILDRLVDGRDFAWDRNCDYVADRRIAQERYSLPVEWARKMYPEFANRIQASGRGSWADEKPPNPGMMGKPYDRTVRNFDVDANGKIIGDGGGKAWVKYEDEEGFSSSEAFDTVDCLETWVGPTPRIEGGMPSRGDGRWVVCVGGVTVEDRTNPFDDRKINDDPYSVNVFDEVRHSHEYGMRGCTGLVYQLIETQIQINRIARQLSDHVQNGLRGKMLIPAGLQNLLKQLQEPGGHVIYQTGAGREKPSWMQPEPFSAAALPIMQAFQDLLSYQSMVTPTGRGVPPTQIRAAKAIQSLNEILEQGVRVVVRNSEDQVGSVGFRQAWRAKQFYKSERVIRITQGDGSSYELRTLQPQMEYRRDPVTGMPELQPMMGADGTPEIDPATGIPMMYPVMDIKSPWESFEFDFSVETGSMLLTDQQAKLGILMRAYTMPMREDAVITTDELRAVLPVSGKRPPPPGMAPVPGMGAAPVAPNGAAPSPANVAPGPVPAESPGEMPMAAPMATAA